MLQPCFNPQRAYQGRPSQDSMGWCRQANPQCESQSRTIDHGTNCDATGGAP